MQREVTRELVWEAATSEYHGSPSTHFVTLLDRFVKSEYGWDDDLVCAVGAAYERLGTIVSSLEFYELVWHAKRIRVNHKILEETEVTVVPV